MRILMICYRYPPDLGGVERAARGLSKELTRIGHQITVIAGADVSSTSRTLEEEIVVHRFPMPTGRASGARYTARVFALARRMPRHDVVHAHVASAPAVTATLVGARTKAPVVVKPSSGAEPGGNLHAMMSRGGGGIRVGLLRRRVDTFIAISARIARDLLDVWGVPPSKVIEIPNGVEIERLRPERDRTSRRKRNYLYVGRLWTKQKALDVLLDAWRKAGEPGTLTFVGDGPDRELLEGLASETVRFTGAVADPSPYYRDADVFVLASRWEGLSNAMLEASAAGLPVIATDVGGARDILGDAGRVVPPDDVEALAEALAAPPSTPVDAERFSQRFGIEGVARRHAELYERLVRERAAR